MQPDKYLTDYSDMHYRTYQASLVSTYTLQKMFCEICWLYHCAHVVSALLQRHMCPVSRIEQVSIKCGYTTLQRIVLAYATVWKISFIRCNTLTNARGTLISIDYIRCKDGGTRWHMVSFAGTWRDTKLFLNTFTKCMHMVYA